MTPAVPQLDREQAPLCDRSPTKDRVLEAAEGLAAIARERHIRTEQFVRQWEDIVRRMG